MGKATLYAERLLRGTTRYGGTPPDHDNEPARLPSSNAVLPLSRTLTCNIAMRCSATSAVNDTSASTDAVNVKRASAAGVLLSNNLAVIVYKPASNVVCADKPKRAPSAAA